MSAVPSPAVLLVYGVGILAVAGIVHVGTILALPARDSGHDAFARVSALAPVAELTVLRSDSDRAVLPYRDAAMGLALCRYDLRAGPLRITIQPFDDGFLSFGFHARGGAAFYGLNLPAGDRNTMTVMVMEAAQRAAAEAGDGDAVAVQALRITAPEGAGFVTIAVPNADRAMAESILAKVGCETATAQPNASSTP